MPHDVHERRGGLRCAAPLNASARERFCNCEIHREQVVSPLSEWPVLDVYATPGEETVAAMLKTTKRFLGQQRFERLSKVFWCENFGVNGGCLYDTPSGGADDAVLWPVRTPDATASHIVDPQRTLRGCVCGLTCIVSLPYLCASILCSGS